MSNWQSPTGFPPRVYGFNPATMSGTAVSMPNTDALNPGAWVEVIPSLPFDTQVVEVNIAVHADAEDSGRFWLGIGAGGSERIVGSFLPFIVGGSGSYRCALPWGLPRGARVALAGHMVNTTNGNILHCHVRVWPRDWNLPAPPTRWRGTYTGAVWAYGTDVTPGTNAFGSYVELLASTPFPVRALAFLGSAASGGGTRRQDARRFAVGGAGNERLLWEFGPGGSAYWGGAGAANVIVAPVPLISRGSRLSCASATVTGGPTNTQTNLMIGG